MSDPNPSDDKSERPPRGTLYTTGKCAVEIEFTEEGKRAIAKQFGWEYKPDSDPTSQLQVWVGLLKLIGSRIRKWTRSCKEHHHGNPKGHGHHWSSEDMIALKEFEKVILPATVESEIIGLRAEVKRLKEENSQYDCDWSEVVRVCEQNGLNPDEERCCLHDWVEEQLTRLGKIKKVAKDMRDVMNRSQEHSLKCGHCGNCADRTANDNEEDLMIARYDELTGKDDN